MPVKFIIAIKYPTPAAAATWSVLVAVHQQC